MEILKRNKKKRKNRKKKTKTNKKKKKKSRKSSPPPLLNFFVDSDSDSDDDSRAVSYREPEPRCQYEHLDLFSRDDMNLLDSTQQPESDEEELDQIKPSNDDVSTSLMPGLQERNREDSSSEDENSQQDPIQSSFKIRGQ